MKRRHGINTSHTKHLTNNQQLQQTTEQTQHLEEDPLSIPQTESTTAKVYIKCLFSSINVCINKNREKILKY